MCGPKERTKLIWMPREMSFQAVFYHWSTPLWQHQSCFVLKARRSKHSRQSHRGNWCSWIRIYIIISIDIVHNLAQEGNDSTILVLLFLKVGIKYRGETTATRLSNSSSSLLMRLGGAFSGFCGGGTHPSRSIQKDRESSAPHSRWVRPG